MYAISAPNWVRSSLIAFLFLLPAGAAVVRGALGLDRTSSPLRDSRLHVFRDQHGQLQMSAPGVAHGVRIGKRCDTPHCPGDLTECIIELGHADSFGDTIEIQAAWDVVDPKGERDRVPASGNLPILFAEGNTTCIAGGELPCLVCAGGATCGGDPAVSNEPGVVVFVQNQYLIEPDDPAVLENQANVLVRDLCDASPSNCSMIPNLVQFTAATDVAQCDDGNPCTTDTCAAGICTNTPDCASDLDCADDGNLCTTETCDVANGCCLRTQDCLSAGDCADDGNVCTTEVCTAEGCCESVPDCTQAADCPDDGNACTREVCISAGCCDRIADCVTAADCQDDGNTCTTEVCTALGCCERIAACVTAGDCNDMDACTSDTCSPSGCCANTPLCTIAADCEDGNVCTTNLCASSGCCEFAPECTTVADCNDGNFCTTDACSPQGCCTHAPQCSLAAQCNDNDACTTDSCTPQGCCANDPQCAIDADCNDQDTCTIDRCTAGCCEREEIPNCLIIPTLSTWGLAIMALLLAIAAKVHFGRAQGSEQPV